MSFNNIDFDKLEEIKVLSENLLTELSGKQLAKGKRVHIANERTKLDIVKKNTVIDVDAKILSEQSFGRYDVNFVPAS